MEARMALSRLMEQARKHGARAAEAHLQEEECLDQRVERGHIEEPVPSRSAALTLRVYLPDGRSAVRTLVPSSLDRLGDQAEPVLREALAEAAQAAPDPFAGPADRYDIEERGLGIADRRRAQITHEDRRTLLEENVAGCVGVHPAIRVERLEYQERTVLRAFASSRGVSATETSTLYQAALRARLGDGRVHEQRAAARQFATVASLPLGIALGERLRSLATPASIPAPGLPVLVDGRAMAQLLRSLAPAFAEPALREGRSFLAGLPQQRLASARLHVIDDPSQPGALRSRAFDERGVPPTPVVIVREGVAAGLYRSPEAARAAGLRPTGHAIGGMLCPSNLVMRPGSRTRNAIGIELGDYLLIENFHAAQPLDLSTGQLASHCDLLVFCGNSPVGAVAARPLSMDITALLMDIREVVADQCRYEDVDASSVLLGTLRFDP